MYWFYEKINKLAGKGCCFF